MNICVIKNRVFKAYCLSTKHYWKYLGNVCRQMSELSPIWKATFFLLMPPSSPCVHGFSFSSTAVDDLRSCTLTSYEVLQLKTSTVVVEHCDLISVNSYHLLIALGFWYSYCSRSEKESWTWSILSCGRFDPSPMFVKTQPFSHTVCVGGCSVDVLWGWKRWVYSLCTC